MLTVDDYYTGTDTGRQRRANEDSLFARAPLFVVADGMGGAQAGEVASRIAVEAFQPGIADTGHPEHELAELARSANERIHSLSHSNAEQAGHGHDAHRPLRGRAGGRPSPTSATAAPTACATASCCA